MRQTHEIYRLTRLLSDARPGDHRILTDDSHLGILPQQADRPSVINRSLRSVSIVLCLDCLTIGFGAHPDRALLAACSPTGRSVERLGANLLIGGFDMDMQLCKLCRAVLTDRRATYCSGTCRSRASWLRRVEDGQSWLALPEGRFTTSPDLLLLPPDEQNPAFLERTLQENAPPRATGYRIGTGGPHSPHIRWFPVARLGRPPWFSLAPFEQPWGPQRGKYAVLYVDDKGRVLDPPRFTIWVERVESGVRFIDGDRGMEPRLRSS